MFDTEKNIFFEMLFIFRMFSRGSQILRVVDIEIFMSLCERD